MPPLSQLNVNSHPAPPSAQGYQSPNQFYGRSATPQQQQQQPVHSPPPEAHIQSWAGDIPQQQPQPRPVAALNQMWSPGMGIKFAPSPAGGQQAPPPQQQGPGTGSGKQTGAWDPSSGIRFG